MSCIYGLGSPEQYEGHLLRLVQGVDVPMDFIKRRLVSMQYSRNDFSLARGTFRVRGDTIEIHPAYEETILRIELFGDTIERMTLVEPASGEVVGDVLSGPLDPRRQRRDLQPRGMLRLRQPRHRDRRPAPAGIHARNDVQNSH